MSDATEKPRAADATRTAWIAATAAVVSALVALGSAGFSYLNRDRELDIRLVEIGIGILRVDPQKSGVSAARRWAITAIEENSEIKFTPEDKARLLKEPLDYYETYAYGDSPKYFAQPPPK